MYPELTLHQPGVGPGWTRLAQTVAERMALDTLDGIWVFRPLRIEKKEWGTAILALAEDDHYRILTVQYQSTIKGRERGAFTVAIKEVGSGPVETLDAMVAAVPKRTDEDPPVRIPLTAWYPEEDARDGPPESA
jgi:hypothetical protein